MQALDQQGLVCLHGRIMKSKATQISEARKQMPQAECQRDLSMKIKAFKLTQMCFSPRGSEHAKVDQRLFCFFFLSLILFYLFCSVLLLLGATQECKRQAGKQAVQGQGPGRCTKQSTNEELRQYKKSGIWKYYRKAGFEIKSPFVRDVKELCTLGVFSKQQKQLHLCAGGSSPRAPGGRAHRAEAPSSTDVSVTLGGLFAASKSRCPHLYTVNNDIRENAQRALSPVPLPHVTVLGLLFLMG